MRPVLFFLAVVGCSALTTYWSEDDTKRLGAVFQQVFVNKKNDIAALHYAASGLKLLKVDPTTSSAQATCDVAKKADLKDLDSLYHSSALAGDLPNCALSSVAGAKETLDAVAKEAQPSSERILKALSAADRLAIKIDKAAFDTALGNALKDSSVASLVSGLNAAAYLDKTQGAKYLPKIEALVAQADIVDKKFMQFEGGLSATANAVHGILSLAAKQAKITGVTKDQVALLANYLLSRKYVTSERAAFDMIHAIGVLVNNQHMVPVAVTRDEGVALTAGKPFGFRVSNLFGLPVSHSSVKADVYPVGSQSPLVKGAYVAPADTKSFAYELMPSVAKVDPEGGVYTVVVNVESQDKRLVGLTGNSLRVKYMREVVVENMQIGVLEKDAKPTGSALNSVAVFSKFSKVLSADHTKRLYVSFAVKTKAGGKSGKPHQAFVVFTHESGAEVIYTADPQGGGQFLVDVNLAKSHKDFDGLSGKYTARLVVGDTLIKNPIDWTFADLSLTLPAAPIVVVPKSEQVIYDPLPEIVHQFRQPEKRPPAVVSSAFTLICLAPLLLLFVMWLRVGINFGNMPVSPWVLIFHGSLAALFALYFVFWLQLNMFETLKYLAMVGTVTFVAGNRVLRAIAEKRKSKSE